MWEERLRGILDKTVDSAQRIVIGSNLINYYLWLGDYAKA